MALKKPVADSPFSSAATVPTPPPDTIPQAPLPPAAPIGGTVPLDQLSMDAVMRASAEPWSGPPRPPVPPAPAGATTAGRRTKASTRALLVLAIVGGLVGLAVIARLLVRSSGGDDAAIALPEAGAPTTVKEDPPPRGESAGPRSDKACGWIPPDAKEIRAVASLEGDSATDPICAQKESILDVGKAVAVSIEKELREATALSDEEESGIGARLERALPTERSMVGKLDQPEDVTRYGKYLTDLVTHLAKGTRPGIHYRVHIVRRPVFNASALPGGVLMVYTGALEGPSAVRDEAELAAVLGHEIAHVEKRHTVAVYQFAKAAGAGDDDQRLAIKVMTMPLSTEHELEADAAGVELAVRGQYDPDAPIRLWRRHAKEGGTPSVESAIEQLLRSHPPAHVRACRLLDKLAWAREHAPCDRLYDGRTNLAERVTGFHKAY